MELSKLIVKSKTVEVEHPTLEGFVVSVAYLTKDELTALRKKCIKSRFGRHSKSVEDEVDMELFQKLYINAILKGWTGLKYKYLSTFFPVDLTSVDPEDELEYNEINCLELMKNANEFDEWITDVIEDLSTFTKGE